MILSLIVLTSGPTRGREIPIRSAQFLIGRDPECQLRPASSLVSGRHCALLQRRDKVLVRDLGSASGTFVNHSRLHGEAELRDGDLLRVGPLLFAVRVKGFVSASRPTPLPPTRGTSHRASPVSGPALGEEDIAAQLLSAEEDQAPLDDDDDLTPGAQYLACK